jgi:hypothetical protein
MESRSLGTDSVIYKPVQVFYSNGYARCMIVMAKDKLPGSWRAELGSTLASWGTRVQTTFTRKQHMDRIDLLSAFCTIQNIEGFATTDMKR